MNKITLCLLAFFATAALAEEVDSRQALNLTAPQRNHVLGEMRALLSGIQAILAGLAQNDMAAVAKAAKPLGMAHSAENHLHSVLPKAFMQMGMSLHKDFDQIALDAETLKDPKQTLQQMSAALSKCNACHATYQILSATNQQASETRLDEVAARGSHVMPFSLEKTTHVFSKTQTGGVQQVIVKDKANVEQIALIRQHLTKISHEFKQGDFSDPAKIHGDAMPGLAELKQAKQGDMQVDYQELPDGAQITYATQQQKLTAAIHQWFDAQLSDHARHAMPGHAMHHN
ncbi:MAG: hypothetical protein ABL903_02185 [Methylococcales bacterium]